MPLGVVLSPHPATSTMDAIRPFTHELVFGRSVGLGISDSCMLVSLNLPTDGWPCASCAERLPYQATRLRARPSWQVRVL